MLPDEISVIAERLDRIEVALAALVEQKTSKEWYATAEAAKIAKRWEYTIREYCRKGQVKAEKASNGRGWLISHYELNRLKNLDPSPEQPAPSPTGELSNVQQI